MPRIAALRFGEPHEYQERIRPAHLQITATRRGRFEARLARVEVDRVVLQHGWQTLPVLARSAFDAARMTVIFHPRAEQPRFLADGTEMPIDGVLQVVAGEEHFFHMAADCDWAALAVDPATYGTARATLLGDDGELPRHARVLQPRAQAVARLRGLHGRIARAVRGAAGRPLHPEAVRAAEQTLLATVVDTLADENAIIVPRLGGRRSTAVMRRLHDLLDASEGLPLYLMDVCAQLGISRRTLHGACVEHVGISPHRFLWMRRMQVARQALLDPGAAPTVTEIAMELGFWELGRFAVQYKWLYGESPSATLARRRP